MRFFRSDKDVKTASPETNPNYDKMVIGVSGMTCNHCKANVERNLLALDGIEDVVANPQTSEVFIKGAHIDLDQIKKTIEEIGYTYSN